MADNDQPTETYESRFDTSPDVNDTYFAAQSEFALKCIKDNISTFSERFPTAASKDLRYGKTENVGWTPSFWTGQLWLAYELTGNAQYRDAALSHLSSFKTRLTDGFAETHDLGFLYTLSAVAPAKLLGHGDARQMALRAADLLADRYLAAPGVVQAWGSLTDPDEDEWSQYGHGRIIIDTMLNLPLLYWAANQTGYDHYHEVAKSHAEQSAEYLVRDDGSTFHTYKFDSETGEALSGETHQGYSDDSTWSRGQAWAIYGFALSYRYTGARQFRNIAADTADYYMTNLPDDTVPYWDFDVADEQSEPRDSSAAAIAACGLTELARQFPTASTQRRRYLNAAFRTLESLSKNYTTEGKDSNGLLDHAVYSNPNDNGVNECCLWGDYFYIEGLIRTQSVWTPYW